MSRAAVHAGWETASRVCLIAELAILRTRIRGNDALAERGLGAARAQLVKRSSLEVMSEELGLSGSERAALLLAAGPEPVSATADEFAATVTGPRLSFGLAPSVLPDVQWNAITPTAAFLGAELGSVSEHDVARATRWELAKSGRTATPVRGVRA